MATPDDDQYVNPDEQYANLINYAPLAAAGVNPDEARANPAMVRAGGNPTQPPTPAPVPRPAAATPGVVTPSGQPKKSWQDYVRQGLEGQQSSLARQQATTIPDESTTVAPLEVQRTQAAQPIDPNQQQYRPGVGTRIIRGIDAIRKGGVLATANPASVGGQAYGAPNGRYQQAEQQQAQQVSGIDNQIAQARKDYQDSLERQKAVQAGNKDVTSGYGNMVTEADTAQGNETRAATGAETARHNQQDEALRRQQEAQSGQYQQGELAAKNRENDISAGRLNMERQRGGGGGGPTAEDPRRQPLIDAATEQINSLRDKWTYQAPPDAETPAAYDDGTGKLLTPQQYIDQKNAISAKLDRDLTSKKMKPLGLRWKVGPGGQEIPVQPASSQAASQSEVKPAVGAPSAAPQQQRAASLPDPETHVFSPSAWKAANPKGDVAKATAQAKSLHYRVVE